MTKMKNEHTKSGPCVGKEIRILKSKNENIKLIENLNDFKYCSNVYTMIRLRKIVLITEQKLKRWFYNFLRHSFWVE